MRILIQFTPDYKFAQTYKHLDGQIRHVAGLYENAARIYESGTSGQTLPVHNTQFRFVDEQGKPLPRMLVSLSSVGNPDFGQDPNRPVPYVKDSLQIIPDLSAAQRFCLSYIEENDLGGGNWSGGQVYTDENGMMQEVAQVSYNGRAWSTDGEHRLLAEAPSMYHAHA